MQLTTANRLRTGLAAIGAAALLIGGINVASDAAGAAKPLLLGKNNKATKTTKLTAKKGPALSLKSKKGPALAVNTTDLVKNLNADSVDGKGVDELEPTLYTATLGANGVTGGATPIIVQTTTLPAGSYQVTMGGYFDVGTGDHVQCAVIDLTKYLASGGSDPSSVFAVAEADDSVNTTSGSGIATVVAGNRFAFFCVLPATTEFLIPMTFTVRKLDRVATAPGLAPTTVPRPARGVLGR